MQKKCRGGIAVEVLGSLLLGLILLTTILARAPALAELSNYNPEGLKATTLEEVLALPDEEIDLATAILILCREWDPSFDVTRSLEEIDRMALALEMRISLEDSPERIVSLINRYLFEESAYTGLADPSYMRKLEYSALPRVIENKKGNCLGLSLLYLALAERLGLPFYAVAVPKHIFIRYDDGKKRINIETTDKGRAYEDSDYEEKFMLHPTYRNYNFYLRNFVKREAIGLFLNNLGGTYYEKGMYDQAISRHKKAIEINPNDPEAHYGLGLTYWHKGMHHEAIAELKEAIKINPNYAEAHFALGIAYDRKEMLDNAIAEYKKAIAVNPNYAEAHYNLGETYSRKGMLVEAIAEYEKVLEINPNDAKAHNNLAVLYYFNGEYSLAIEHCDKVIELGYKVHPQFLEDLKPYRQK